MSKQMKTQKLLGKLFVPSTSCRDSILKINTLGLLSLDEMNLATGKSKANMQP